MRKRSRDYFTAPDAGCDTISAHVDNNSVVIGRPFGNERYTLKPLIKVDLLVLQNPLNLDVRIFLENYAHRNVDEVFIGTYRLEDAIALAKDILTTFYNEEKAND